MAKSVKKKISILDILKGKFLIEEGASKNWSFLLFLASLAVIMITSTHQLEQKVSKIVKTEKEVRELKSEYTNLKKELLTFQTESEIEKLALKDCLKVSDIQPYKLKVVRKKND